MISPIHGIIIYKFENKLFFIFQSHIGTIKGENETILDTLTLRVEGDSNINIEQSKYIIIFMIKSKFCNRETL